MKLGHVHVQWLRHTLYVLDCGCGGGWWRFVHDQLGHPWGSEVQDHTPCPVFTEDLQSGGDLGHGWAASLGEEVALLVHYDPTPANIAYACNYVH